MAFLVQMRQCNKSGSVRNDEYSTYTWDLVRALESASPASCKRPATYIDSIRANNQPGKSKESRKRSNSQKLCHTAFIYVHRTQG